MTSELQQRIIDKLTKFLNRAPTENEILNGQTDSNLIGWINKDIQEEHKVDIAALAEKTNTNLPSKNN